MEKTHWLPLQLCLDFKDMSPNPDQSVPAVVFKEGQILTTYMEKPLIVCCISLRKLGFQWKAQRNFPKFYYMEKTHKLCSQAKGRKGSYP